MKMAIFCGASLGNHPLYEQKSLELADWMAVEGHDLVFGGGKVGLMGVMADRGRRTEVGRRPKAVPSAVKISGQSWPRGCSSSISTIRFMVAVSISTAPGASGVYPPV